MTLSGTTRKPDTTNVGLCAARFSRHCEVLAPECSEIRRANLQHDSHIESLETCVPVQVQQPSPFIADTGLTAKVQADLLRYGSAWGRVSNPRHAGHVVSVASAAVEELRNYLQRRTALLDQELASLKALSVQIQDRSCATPVPLGSAARLVFWDCLACLPGDSFDRESLRLTGAIALLLLQKPGSITQSCLRALSHVAYCAGSDQFPAAMAAFRLHAGPLLDRLVKQWISNSKSRASAAASVEEASIERQWSNALAFADPKTLAGRHRAVDLSIAEVKEACSGLRRGAEAGDRWCLAIALAVWIGVSLLHTLRLVLFGASGEGLIRIEGESRWVEVNLCGVLSALAAPLEGDGAKPTSDVLRLPMPRWLAAIVRALRLVDPGARTIESLLKLNARAAPTRIPGLSGDVARSVTVAKLIRSRALVLVGLVDQLALAYACLDFGRIEKSTPHYRAVPHSAIAAVSAARAEAYQWGEICSTEGDSEICIGSRNTPDDRMALELVTARQRALADARCGPNAGWPSLRRLFNELVRYTLLMAAIAWVLRGVTVYGIKASMLRHWFGTDWTDKRVGDGEGLSTEFFAGPVLSRQFALLGANVASIRRRIDTFQRRGWNIPVSAIAHLDALLAGDPDTLMFCVIEEDGTVRPCGHADLIHGLEIDWPFRPDALRHAGADGYAAVAGPTALVEVLLRHLTELCRLRSDATLLTVDAWRPQAAQAQDALLHRFQAHPMGGMVNRIDDRREHV